METEQEQAVEVEVQPQTEEQITEAPEMVAKTELDKIVAEREKLSEELKRVKQTQSGYDKAYTKVSQAVDTVQQQLQALHTEAQNQKLMLMAKAQSGTLDETHGSLEQQIASIDRDTQSKAAGLQSKQQAESFYAEVRDSVFELITNAGLDPKDLSNSQVADIESEWRKAVTSGSGLGAVIKKAASLVAQKTKAEQVPVQASNDEIKKQVEQAVHEQVKKSSALRVDTGMPTAAISTARDIIARFANGDPNVSAKEYEEARRKIVG